MNRPSRNEAIEIPSGTRRFGSAECDAPGFASILDKCSFREARESGLIGFHLVLESRNRLEIRTVRGYPLDS